MAEQQSTQNAQNIAAKASDVVESKASDVVESKKATPQLSIGEAARLPDVEPAKSTLVAKGAMVRAVHGDMIDSITLVKYPAGSWTEVEHPSLWLDGQVRAKKVEVRA